MSTLEISRRGISGFVHATAVYRIYVADPVFSLQQTVGYNLSCIFAFATTVNRKFYLLYPSAIAFYT